MKYLMLKTLIPGGAGTCPAELHIRRVTMVGS
jgi:hypothetical protein